MKQTKNKTLKTGLMAAASLSLSLGGAAAATFTEVGDAGQTLATVQGTASAAAPAGTALTSISGTIPTTAQQDADLYAFRIDTPTTFSVTTVGGTTLDTAVFLFSTNGAPIATNDDASSGTSTGSTLSAGNTLYANLPAGTYFLGISLSGNEAVNSVSQLLFNPYPGGDSTATRGAASGLNPATLSNFNSNALGGETTSAYAITLTGASTAAVPEPSTCVLLTLGATATISLLRKSRRTEA